MLGNVMFNDDMVIISDIVSRSESKTLAPFSHRATRLSWSMWAPSPISGNGAVVDKPKLYLKRDGNIFNFQ